MVMEHVRTEASTKRSPKFSSSFRRRRDAGFVHRAWPPRRHGLSLCQPLVGRGLSPSEPEPIHGSVIDVTMRGRELSFGPVL